MSVNLVLLKSGEELITDVKEIKSGNEIVGLKTVQVLSAMYKSFESGKSENC